MSEWRNRIVGYDVKSASDFLAHALNWRIHPSYQQGEMKGALDTLGWDDDVTENKRTGNLLDGHMRVMLALRQGDATPVPVKYVDLSPEEEAQYLATHDPLGDLAIADQGKVAALQQLAGESAKLLALVAAAKPVAPDNRTAYQFLSEPANGDKPAERPALPVERFPLAIVLTNDEYRTWQKHKEAAGVKDDKAAFMALLEG